MISLTNLNPADYLNELDHFAFDVSIAGIVACCYIMLLFIISKRYKRIPHRITCCLVLSQLVGCVGVILWSTLGSQPGNKSTLNGNGRLHFIEFITYLGWQMYLQFSLFTIGNYSSRLWAALLAISLLFLQCRSLCFVLKLWPLFVSPLNESKFSTFSEISYDLQISVAWGVPTVLVIALLLLDQTNISTNEKRNPNFQYGNAQAAVSIFLLVMCFIGKSFQWEAFSTIYDRNFVFFFQSPAVAWYYINDTKNDSRNISACREKLASRPNQVSHFDQSFIQYLRTIRSLRHSVFWIHIKSRPIEQSW